jgi:alpha-methylacyl-CoA racemase
MPGQLDLNVYLRDSGYHESAYKVNDCHPAAVLDLRYFEQVVPILQERGLARRVPRQHPTRPPRAAAPVGSAAVGPLRGIKVVEFAGIGPGPFGAMVLADLGAEVIRIVRPGASVILDDEGGDTLSAGRAELSLDLKDPAAAARALAILQRADALIDPFRPGVMERNGLGPEVVNERNPALVYARMTGYGQDGPLAARAGHDINYISVACVLGAIARAGERPLAPLNLVGDFGGGGMLLALGIVSAIVHARATGEGQVVDVAMVDGAALLATMVTGFHQAGQWSETAGTNALDSGAPFNDTYETSDGRYVAVGALEPQFHARLLELLQIEPGEMSQWDRDHWPEHRARLTAIFATETRDHWARHFEHEDACVTAVLGIAEGPGHPQMQARHSFTEVGGRLRASPAPRFARTPGEVRATAPAIDDILHAWGVTP